MGGYKGGLAPLSGVWGCPPDSILAPFQERKGARGIVQKDIKRPLLRDNDHKEERNEKLEWRT